mmetsp:Transcript_62822/g.149660  ORF Transcript_62822/g.149660 Transcript_62822/m.149660 type:complete len:377 (-) Transcript_62822:371-1501(-)
MSRRRLRNSAEWLSKMRSDRYSSSSRRSRKDTRFAATTIGSSSSSIIAAASACAWASLLATEVSWPVASSERSGFSLRTIISFSMLPMHRVHTQLSRVSRTVRLSPSCSSISKEMGMWFTPPRVDEESNCAAIRCTRTCAVIDGEIWAVASSSSWAICSLREVPFLPRCAIISASFFWTFSSLSTITSLDTTSFSLISLTAPITRSFFSLGFFTASKPSSSESGSSVFIHLEMPVLPAMAGSSSEEDESEDCDQSESESESSSSEPLTLATFSGFSFFFFLSSSESESDSESDPEPLSLDSPDALPAFSPSSSPSSSSAGLSMYLAISVSYWELFFLMFCFIALSDLAFVLDIFFTFSLSFMVFSTRSASLTIAEM